MKLSEYQHAVLYLSLVLVSYIFPGIVTGITYILGVNVDRIIKLGIVVTKCLPSTSGLIKLMVIFSSITTFVVIS